MGSGCVIKGVGLRKGADYEQKTDGYTKKTFHHL